MIQPTKFETRAAFNKGVSIRGGTMRVGTASKPTASEIIGDYTLTGDSTNLVWDKETSKLTNGTGVVPVYLPVTVAATVTSAGAIPVTSSFVRLNPGTDGVAYTIAAGTIVGQMMNLVSLAATNQANVTVLGLSGTTIGAAQIAAAGFNRIVLSTAYDTATIMWNGDYWFLTNLSGATAAVSSASS
jgi:hypothetical protein